MYFLFSTLEQLWKTLISQYPGRITWKKQHAKKALPITLGVRFLKAKLPPKGDPFISFNVVYIDDRWFLGPSLPITYEVPPPTLMKECTEKVMWGR